MTSLARVYRGRGLTQEAEQLFKKSVSSQHTFWYYDIIVHLFEGKIYKLSNYKAIDPNLKTLDLLSVAHKTNVCFAKTKFIVVINLYIEACVKYFSRLVM